MTADASWFDDARFGMFIHWSHCSQAGLELSWPMVGGVGSLPNARDVTVAEYEQTAATFDPRPGAASPSASLTTSPPVASSIAMSRGVPSRPASAVTTPATVTVAPIGSPRASPMGRGMDPGDGVGDAVGAGRLGAADGDGLDDGLGDGLGEAGGWTTRSPSEVAWIR